VAPLLSAIAQLGVVLYMFQVGLELDLSRLKGKARRVLSISGASMALPFALGAALAPWLYARFAPAGVASGVFGLFVCVAMSITAFPVLARILQDEGLSKSDLGVLALSCAAVNDAAAWCLLALVVGLAQSEASRAAFVGLEALAFVAFMLFFAGPKVARLARAKKKPGQGTASLVFMGILLSALATEAIGIHAIFGAFLLGLVIPHDSAVAMDFEHKLKDVVGILLLPAFFALSGMRTQLGLLDSREAWAALGLVIALASLGKIAGTGLAARLSGLGLRDSSALGVLMNTRGLVELIVLNVGLDLGVLSPSLFSIMVLMALASTLATGPALHALGYRVKKA
jgi:Kef-type K+ transport system membrane component KefB